MQPVINSSTEVIIYKVSDDATLHSFRHRWMNKDYNLEELIRLNTQMHFWSKDDLRNQNEIGFVRTLGYFLVRTADLVRKGVVPTEDEWINLPFRIPELGDHLYKIKQVRPICPLKRSKHNFLFRRVEFEEYVSESVPSAIEHTVEPVLTPVPGVTPFEEGIEIEAW